MKARHEFDSDKSYQEYLKTYFAAMAMQGWCASSYNPTYFERMANDAVDIADALINALNQTKWTKHQS